MSLISIIIPVYNVENFIRKCLDSLITQTYRDIEIIAVDDGSTDNSLQICREYAQNDDRIKVLTQKNQGPSVARNNALKIAKGEFIGFVDSDDFVKPETFEKAVKMMTPGVDMVIWGVNVFTNDNSDINVDWFQNYFNFKEEGVKTLSQNKKFEISVVPWNKLYRHSIIKKHKIDFPAGRLYEDNAFWWKYTMWCKRVYFLPERLHYYNMRLNSLRGEVIHRKQELECDRIYMVQDVYEYCLKYNIYKKNKNLIERLLVNSFTEAVKVTDNPASIALQTLELAHTLGLDKSPKKENEDFISLVKGSIEKEQLFENQIQEIKQFVNTENLAQNRRCLKQIYETVKQLYDKKQDDKIIEILSALSEKNPKIEEFHRLLGDTYYFLKRDNEEALKSYLKYTGLIHNNASVYNVISDIYEQKGDIYNQLIYKQKALNA